MIEPGKKGNGYSWSPDGLTVTITGASEKYILSNTISGSVTVNVDADEVTLNGNGIPIAGIRGQPTLDLENVYVNGVVFFRYSLIDEAFFGITECRNIKSSSIVLENIRGKVFGLGQLYGNLDDTTIITVTGDKAFGVASVYDNGVISGGVFTVTGNRATGVSTVGYGGKISGGKFIMTGESYAFGVQNVGDWGVQNVGANGEISGGEFIVNGDEATGVSAILNSGKISGGVFTLTGDKAFGVWFIHDFGKISGGEFIVNGDEAVGVENGGQGKISGGEFNVNGVRQSWPT